jgi:hypothetical protein
VFHYERIKILTKEGEKYANVELPFVSVTQTQASQYGEMTRRSTRLLAGRFIQMARLFRSRESPTLKVMEKGQDMKVQERVFTLPDVEVGSIIEYRYATRIADNIYEAPDWYHPGRFVR